MKVVIIGSGNVAWHLAKRIASTAHQLLQFVNLHSHKISPTFDSFHVPFCYSLKEMNETADIYLIAVSDDEIGSLHLPVLSNKQIILHTSGIANIDLLRHYGNNYGCLYPLQTLTKGVPVDFSKVPLLMEASNVMTKEMATIFASSLSDHLLFIPLHQRRILHLSAVLVNNFTNHLFTQAKSLLDEESLSFDLLKPLIEETFRKIQTIDPLVAQTGPAKRNDNKTISIHQILLNGDDDLLALYQLFTISIQKQYHE